MRDDLVEQFFPEPNRAASSVPSTSGSRCAALSRRRQCRQVPPRLALLQRLRVSWFSVFMLNHSGDLTSSHASLYVQKEVVPQI